MPTENTEQRGSLQNEQQEHLQSEAAERTAEKKLSLEDLKQATTANDVLLAYVELSKSSADKAGLMMLAGETLARLGETIKAMQFIMAAEQTINFKNFENSTERLNEIVSSLDRSLDGFEGNALTLRSAFAALGSEIQVISSATNRMEEVASTTNRAARGMQDAAEKMQNASARISDSADSISTSSYRMNNR